MNNSLQNLQWENIPKTSLYVLLAANLIPVLGVMVLGWRIGDIMFLFWFENVIIGAFNGVRMAVAGGGGIVALLIRLPRIAFFMLHYGVFTFAHGIFVIALFLTEPAINHLGPDGVPPNPLSEATQFSEPWQVPETDGMMDDEFIGELELAWLQLQDILFASGLWVAVLALIISHGISLVINYIQGKEYLNVTVDNLMLRPYGRVVILHVVIIFGGMLVIGTGQLTGALLLLIVLKIALDAGAHIAEHGILKKPVTSKSE